MSQKSLKLLTKIAREAGDIVPQFSLTLRLKHGMKVVLTKC